MAEDGEHHHRSQSCRRAKKQDLFLGRHQQNHYNTLGHRPGVIGTVGVQSWQNFPKVVCRLGWLWAMKKLRGNDFSGKCFLVYYGVPLSPAGVAKWGLQAKPMTWGKKLLFIYTLTIFFFNPGVGWFVGLPEGKQDLSSPFPGIFLKYLTNPNSTQVLIISARTEQYALFLTPITSIMSLMRFIYV